MVKKIIKIAFILLSIASLAFVPWRLVKAWILPLPSSVQEQELYTSLYEYEHKGWVPGYQSIAKYHSDMDAVIVLFTSTTDPDLYNWNLADIVYRRIVEGRAL